MMDNVAVQGLASKFFAHMTSRQGRLGGDIRYDNDAEKGFVMQPPFRSHPTPNSPTPAAERRRNLGHSASYG